MKFEDIAVGLLEGDVALYEPPEGIVFTEAPPDYAAYTPEQLRRVEMAVEGITAALDAGPVRFRFFAVIKQRIRLAYGTRNTALFSYSFKGGAGPRRFGLVAYWDFLVAPAPGGGQWRSFYVANVQMEPRGVLTYPNTRRGVIAGPNVPGSSTDLPSFKPNPLFAPPERPRYDGQPPDLEAPE